MGRRTGVSALRNPGGAQLDVHEEGDVGLCISCLPTRVPPKLALALADSSYAGASLSCHCAKGESLLKPAPAAGQPGTVLPQWPGRLLSRTLRLPRRA